MRSAPVKGRFLRLRRLGCLALDDKLLHCAQLRAPERAVLIGLGERPLNVRVPPGGDFDSGVYGKTSRFDALDEVVFAVSEQIDDAVDVASVQAELFGNRRWLVNAAR